MFILFSLFYFYCTPTFYTQYHIIGELQASKPVLSSFTEASGLLFSSYFLNAHEADTNHAFLQSTKRQGLQNSPPFASFVNKLGPTWSRNRTGGGRGVTFS